ncbi:methyltransferase domain-containing protein [Candidatus Berkelbacteria bacterium]|nr:methyltransferase domain-containing protein [Candidatus Berkelbacteria bacterium]
MTAHSSDFYTQFAPKYAIYAAGRKSYLETINRLIAEQIIDSEQLLDVGAGDGQRVQTIVQLLHRPVSVTAVDDSSGMIEILCKRSGITAVQADIANERLPLSQSFDTILCLWNVFGHIETAERRLRALNNLAHLLAPTGILFLDVNNRYNVAHYGLQSAIRNIAADWLRPSESNGDFPLSIEFGTRRLSTSVHIFAPWEIERLFSRAGLRITKRTVVNYATGQVVPSIFQGQLMYQLERA